MMEHRKDHTPGPWHVEDGALVKGVEPAGYFVCHPRTECDTTALCWTERKADADVFAAGLEMLSALEWYADQFCEFGTSNEGCGKFDSDVCSGCKARAVSYVARGAEPAKAIEARRAETGTGSVHESAVAQPFAQNIPGDPV